MGTGYEHGLLNKMAEQTEGLTFTEEDLEIKSFFENVLLRTEEILQEDSLNHNESYTSDVLTHIDLLERTIALPSQLSRVVTDETDLKLLKDLQLVFSELLEKYLQHFGNNTSRQTRVSFLPCSPDKCAGPGRPSVYIPPEILEDLRELGFSWEKIARMFRVSRWTIMRRVRALGLEHLTRFSSLTDRQIDNIIQSYISHHGNTTGESYLRGHFRALGYTVPRRRIRESLNRVDPRNSALRWGALVSRRVYFVPW